MTEYIIKNGFIVNGKMEKPFLGTVVVKDGIILEIAPFVEIPSDFPKDQILDAGAVALTCGSSFYISNTKRRASKSPAFVV